MNDSAGQCPLDLVEILKRLGAHRRKVHEEAYASELRCKLDKIAETLLKSLQDHDYRAAGETLCRFVDAAGVACSDDARKRMLANLDAFMLSRLAALASGTTGFRATFAALGPEAEAAFDLWDRIGKSPPLPGERGAYWHHPVLLACRWLEEHSGINRDDWEAAAFRLTTPWGLREMDPLTGPGGRTTDAGQPDLLWMISKFRELDRDGTTARLWQSLVEKYQAILEEAGMLVPLGNGGGDENDDAVTAQRQQPGEPAGVTSDAQTTAEQPATKPAPGYLGLIVDVKHAEVRRAGERYEQLPPVCFEVGTAEWHTFLVAFQAGEHGASEDAWKNDYHGDWKSGRKNAKHRAAAKLNLLDIAFEHGKLKLKEKT